MKKYDNIHIFALLPILGKFCNGCILHPMIVPPTRIEGVPLQIHGSMTCKTSTDYMYRYLNSYTSPCSVISCRSATANSLLNEYNKIHEQSYYYNTRTNNYICMLSFYGSSIIVIPKGVFDINNMLNKNLLRLEISQSKVKNIQHEAFQYLGLLKELYLRGNEIQSLQSGSLIGLKSLKRLDISYNKLSGTLDKNNLTGVEKNLIYLDISNNHIDVIRNDCLQNFLNLNNLDASHNNLKQYHRKYSISLQCIINFDLTTIVNFEESRKIYLLVAENNIMNIANISMCTKATLSHLNLEVLYNISMCNSGTILDASYNKLKTMPVWSEMKAVQTVYLQHNHMSDIPLGIFDTLKSLTYLRLDKNRITNLKVGVFSGLEQLKSLNLSCNQLVHIDQFALYGLNKLEELYLEGNQLISIPSDDILAILPQFKIISLNQNHWICNDLLDILRKMRKQKIHIVNSKILNYHDQNLEGIPCWQKFHLIPNVTTTDTKDHQFENRSLLLIDIASRIKSIEMNMNKTSQTLQALLDLANQSSTISTEENSFQNTLSQIIQSISHIATIIFGSQNTSASTLEQSNKSAKFLALELQKAAVERGNFSKDMHIIKIMFVVIIVSISCFILTAICNINRRKCCSKRQMVQKRSNASEIPLTEKINNIF